MSFMSLVSGSGGGIVRPYRHKPGCPGVVPATLRSIPKSSGYSEGLRGGDDIPYLVQRAAQPEERAMSEGLETPRPLVVMYRPVDELTPDPRNARTHPKRQIEQIKASITGFGFTNPILADPEGHLIAGHGRLIAARALGMTEVPVIALSGLSEAQKRALRLADNKIALNAGWDIEILQSELAEL